MSLVNVMLLSELKAFLKQKGRATLAELASEFGETPEMIRCMMCHFINKGSVTENTLTPKCGTACQSCQLANVTVYQWV